MPHAGFNLTFGAKRRFFDRAAVIRSVDAITRLALGKAGALVRMISQRSMRYVTSQREKMRQVEAGERKRLTGESAPSAPGTPPHAVRPHPWIREHLYYAYEPAGRTVVIGPVRLSSRVNVPALHEYGGRVFMRNRRRVRRKIGSGGEIRVGGRACRTTKPAVDRHGATVQVTYARLRTGAQAARANNLNEALYGPASYTANYPPRPFMGPALAAALPSLPKLWATSVRAA
jgi:hypothetical protein